MTGTVTNAATSAPATSGYVALCTPQQNCTYFPFNSSSGVYTATVPPGTYYAFTEVTNSLNLINEIFDNVQCPGICSGSLAVGAGTPIVVGGGATLTRDFALAPGGQISGLVTDSVSGLPIAGMIVVGNSRVGSSIAFAGNVVANGSGAYALAGLPTGTYYLYTNGVFGGRHTNEIYDDILCPAQCTSALAVDSGVPIAVVTGATTAGINFAVAPAGKISGTIRDSVTSLPLQGIAINAYARIGLTPTFAATATSDASGNYTLSFLPSGDYAVMTATSVAVNEFYNNIECAGSCSAAEALATGQLVRATSGQTTPGIDFALGLAGSISGTVRAAPAMTGIQSSVQLYRQVGGAAVFVNSTTASASGSYSFDGLPAGAYFLSASPPSGSNVNAIQVLGGPSCVVSCQPSEILAGSVVLVASGAISSGRDITLPQAGGITGTVRNGATATGVSSGLILLPSASGTNLLGFSISSNGSYAIPRLAAGTYRIATSVPNFGNEVFDNVACPAGACQASFIASNAAAITVVAGVVTTGIDFSIDPVAGAPGAPLSLSAVTVGSAVEIRWNAPGLGGAATSYIVEGGLTLRGTVGALPTTLTSLTIPGLPPGTYYVRVKAMNAFGIGPASPDLVLNVGNAGGVAAQPPRNVLAWTSGARLNVTWAAPLTGPTPTDYLLEAGSAAGVSNIGVLPVSGRAFTFEPVPPGFYFLRVRSRENGVSGPPSPDVMVNVGGVAAPPSPPQDLTATVAGSLVTFSWTPPVLATPTSYVVEAGSAIGFADLAVANTGSTATTLTVPGVPSGTYYIRLRAVNAVGTSAASNERLLVVP